MEAQMEQIFAPLRVAMLSHPYTLGDLLEVVGRFAQSPGQQHIAAAVSFHASDVLAEHDGVVLPYNELIAEAYRRTFFDAEKAAIYQTDQMLLQGPEHMKQFADYLIGSIGMDTTQVAAGSSHTSTARH